MTIIDSDDDFFPLLLFIYRWKQNGKRFSTVRLQFFSCDDIGIAFPNRNHIQLIVVGSPFTQSQLVLSHSHHKKLDFTTLTFIQEPFEMGKDIRQSS